MQKSRSVTEWKSLSASDFYFKINEILTDPEFSFTELAAYAETAMKDKQDILDLINNLIFAISEKEAISRSIANEIAEMQARKDRFNNQSDYLRNALKMVMDKCELTKIECPMGTVSKTIRKASRVNVVDEGTLLLEHPELYVKPEPKLDRRALKELLEQGVQIEGVELLDTETIQIRK